MESFTDKDNGELDDVESSILVNIVSKWSQFLNDTTVTSRQKKLAWDNIALRFNKATYDVKKRRRPVEFLIEHYERLQSHNSEESIKKQELVADVEKQNLKKRTTKRPKSRKVNRTTNGMTNIGMTNHGQMGNSHCTVPLYINDEFKQYVLSQSKTTERLHKKEVKLRMEHSKQAHAKGMEIMELKKKKMLFELNRLRAAAYEERRKRVFKDEPAERDSDGHETKNNSAEKGLKEVERTVNETSKKGASVFRRWWKSLSRKMTTAMRRSGAAAGIQQTECSQKRPTDSDCAGDQLATAKLSKMTLFNEEKKFKEERVSEWLIEELKPEISHVDGDADLQEDRDLGISAKPINGGNREKASCKKILIEEIISQKPQTTNDEV